MLAADKLLLQSSIRQNSIALKEKEFNLHHGNFNAVGTQAAVLAGFTVTAFIEFDCPPDTNRATKFAYYVSSIVSLAANILCVANTTFLSVWGTGLAMRGPDGSMARAVDGMYQLRRNVFALFGLGMMALLVTAIFGSWILMNVEAGLRRTPVRKSKFDARARAESPRRPPRHRRDACFRWRGDAGSSPLDRARDSRRHRPRKGDHEELSVHQHDCVRFPHRRRRPSSRTRSYMTWSYRSITVASRHFNEDDAVSFDDLRRLRRRSSSAERRRRARVRRREARPRRAATAWARRHPSATRHAAPPPGPGHPSCACGSATFDGSFAPLVV